MPKHLTYVSRFALFVTSYAPLFLLIIVRQFFNNIQYLKWGGISQASILLFFGNFGLSVIMFIVSSISITSTLYLLNNLHKGSIDGVEVLVKDVKNLRGEAVSYIGTYIIPFLFQNYNSWTEVISLSILLFIIYKVYINSSMLLVNPFLAMMYPIFEVVVVDSRSKETTCMIITKGKNIEDNSIIRLNSIGHKLYYARKMDG